MNGMIFDIQRSSVVDGPGIRTTVFLKGCNLKCKWCHNPESQSFKQQMMFYRDKCTGCGKCKEVCPNHMEKCDFCGKCVLYCPHDARQLCGKEYSCDEVIKEVIKDKIFYENSGGGVTFSGGECMMQIDFLEEALKKCKENEIHTAVDTAGNVSWESFERILPYTDLFLYDVKCFTEELHKEGTGASNKKILENLQKISESFSGDIIIRIPIITGFNDDIEELKKISDMLKSIKYTSVELLPYHRMGENKYNAIDMQCTLYEVPSKEKMDEYKKLFNA